MSTVAAAERKTMVIDYIDDHADEFVEFFRGLVQTISADPPGNEKAIADACANFARDLGMDVRQHEAAPNRTNNICRLRGSVGSPVLLFNSHLDTFPAGDPSAWRYPPYAAEVHDGKVWGVGTRDMKAGLSAALLAVQTITGCEIAMRGDVVLTHTADHIRGGGEKGLKFLIDQDLVHADFGVYTEANPPAKVEIAARGMLRFDIVVHGYAKHTKYKVEKSRSGQPVNAVLKAARVIEAIEAMSFTGWQPHRYVPGPPVISVNGITGGFSDSMIPDRCVLRVDCRILPNQDPEHVIEDVQRVLDDLMAGDPELKAELAVVLRGDPVEVDEGEHVVGAIQSAISDVIGHDLPLGGVGSTSDMRFIVNNAHIPMCKFMFPTSETGTNENESIEDFLNTVKVYAMLILNEIC